MGQAGKPNAVGGVMAGSEPDRVALDVLALAAAGGDAEAERILFADLRVRFLTIGKRRVHEDQCEDLVQDALRIVHGKYTARPAGRGVLIWSLTVLRNVIGNYYQAERRRRGLFVDGDGSEIDRLPARDPAEPDGELAEQLARAVAELALRHPRCARIFRWILECAEEGASPREMNAALLTRMRAGEPDISRGSFYVMLHRCRSRLRVLFDPEEVDHEPR